MKMTKPSSYSLAVVIHFGVALVLDTLCAETEHFSAVSLFLYAYLRALLNSQFSCKIGHRFYGTSSKRGRLSPGPYQ